jgi:hypothetical protein
MNNVPTKLSLKVRTPTDIQLKSLTQRPQTNATVTTAPENPAATTIAISPLLAPERPSPQSSTILTSTFPKDKKPNIRVGIRQGIRPACSGILRKNRWLGREGSAKYGESSTKELANHSPSKKCPKPCKHPLIQRHRKKVSSQCNE